MSFSRRNFLSRTALGGLAAAGVAPWLPATEAAAGVDGIAKRLILFYHPFGTQYDAWRPSGTTSDFSFAGRNITSALEPHKQDLVVLDGMRIHWNSAPGDEHQKGMALLWSGSPPEENDLFIETSAGDAPAGWCSGITVDNFVANQLNAGTPFSTLQLGVDTPEKTVRTRMSYLGAASPIDPIQDPSAAFTTLFGEQDISSDEIALLKAKRLAVLNRTQREVASLRGRVGAADAQRFDAHLSALDAVRDELDALDADCGAVEPEMPGGTGSAFLPQTTRAQIDLMVQALACGLTNVAGLQIKDERGGYADWLPSPPEGTYHAMSHAAIGQTSGPFTDTLATYTAQFVHLLDRLKATPMADGQSLFDHSLVVWGSAMGTGNHTPERVPFILSGGCQGDLELGRYLRYEETVRHQRLLVSICRLMGLQDVDSFGSMDNGQGPLSGLHA